MHWKPFHSFFFVVLLFLGMGQAVWALDEFPFPEEMKLLSLINEARRAPLAMAAKVGMDPAQVLADFPEWEGVLENGLPPLVLNQALQEAAVAHAHEMLDRNYYGSVSPEGSTPLDRMVAEGYLPGKTGESLGLITFLNFISPDDAVWFIFSNLFADELTIGEKERNILDPDMKEIGIAVASGRWLMAGTPANAYVATCDFGASRVSASALVALELINQARAHPLQVAASLGLDPASLLDTLPELREVLENGLPPVTWNRTLFAAAEAHGWDMLKRGYYSQVTPEGLGWEDRMIAAGYVPIESGESMRILVSVDLQDPMEVVRDHFERILLREFRPDSDNRTILNPAFSEVGISFIEADPADLPDSAGEFSGYNNYLLVMDFGSREGDAESMILGRVFRDEDGDGLYSPGEGAGGARIFVQGNGMEQYVLANSAGGFEIPLPPASYEIEWTDADGRSLVKLCELAEAEHLALEIMLENADGP